jgi:cell volume regulation protein A
VPIVLATIPITAGLPAAWQIFDVVFLLVVVFTVVQGPLLPLLARWLGVAESDATREVTIDSAPLEEVHASLLQVSVNRRSRLAGVHLYELRLPPGSLVTLVLRDGRPFVPGPDTDIRRGDHLLVVTTDAQRAATERRLRAVSRAGRLAAWHGEHGHEDPPPQGAAAGPHLHQGPLLALRRLGGRASAVPQPEEPRGHPADPPVRRPGAAQPGGARDGLRQGAPAARR